MRRIVRAAAVLALTVGMTASAKAPPTPAPTAEDARIAAVMRAIHPLRGDVAIPVAKAVLHLGQGYTFLGAADAKRVLTDIWGNPPEAVGDVLGLVLPSGKTPLDDTWGAVVTWQETGYVSDKDARTADYAEVLAQLREGEAALNERRAKDGYPAQHLVGWAQAPTYDAAQHAMVWAQDIAYDRQKADTLNYDVRLLGRTGVLSLNMVASMGQLAETRTAAAAFARTAGFQPGARYADYRSGDRMADYGLAGLVAAGVGAVAVKKLGLLVLVFGFGKKFIILFVALFAGLGSRLKRLFGRAATKD